MNNRKRNLLICLYWVSMTGIVSHAQDQNIASLIQQLEHTDVAVQNRARQSLVEIGEAAVPALIEALSDDDKVYRENATWVLARIGQPAVPALIAALDHENAIVRLQALDSLRTMKKPFSSYSCFCWGVIFIWFSFLRGEKNRGEKNRLIDSIGNNDGTIVW